MFFVSDGADAIRWVRQHYFPDALELPDWHHLAEQLRAAIGPARPDHLAEALALAGQGDVPSLRGRLSSWAFEDRSDDPAALRLAGAAGYVSANRPGIEHYRMVLVASSGPMEKAVDFQHYWAEWFPAECQPWPSAA